MPFHPDQTYPPGIGVDEVGRGAWCGPVIVAAVWFDPAQLDPDLLLQLDDSKAIASPRRRAVLAQKIQSSVPWALGAGSVRTIDRDNILQATLQAMDQAVQRLPQTGAVFIDGQHVPKGLAGRAQAIIQGDAQVPQIAAASIIAKVCRDRMMEILGQRYPGYGWERNVGYGGNAQHAHTIGLHQLGITRHHRKSFKPVREAERMHAAG